VTQDDFDIRAAVSVLQRQRRLIAATVAVFFSFSLAYCLVAAPIFRATTLVQVDAQGSNLLDPNAANQQQATVLNARLDSEVEILRASSMALAVVQAGQLIASEDFGAKLGFVEKLGLALGLDLSPAALRSRFGLSAQDAAAAVLVNDTLRKLQKAVDIQRQGLSYLIAITVSASQPQTAADIANLYAATYIDLGVANKTTALIAARDVLRRQIGTAQSHLAASDDAVNSFVETNLARLEAESGDPAIADLRRQMQAAQTAQAAASQRLAKAETALGAQNWRALSQSLGDAALAELDRQRLALTARLSAAAQGSAKAADLAAELTRLDGRLTDHAQRALDLVQASLSQASLRETAARDSLRAALLQSSLSAEMLAELFNLQQSATLARSQYQMLLAREQDMGTLANLQIADARVVAQALPPAEAAAPKKAMILGMAAIVGLGLGAMLAFLKEYALGGITSAHQLQNVLHAGVSLSVPEVARRDAALPADLVTRAALSPYAESFRKLRAALDWQAELAPAPSGARVILICSALEGEGKTTTAIALARSYALSGAAVLLIDADLRKPSVAARLGATAPLGLLDYLQSAEPLAPQWLHDPLSPLRVMPAGARQGGPTDQLLTGKAWQDLLAGLRQDFDVIVIDSPPILPVVDTRYLLRQADAVVQVVRYGTTPQAAAREAAQQVHDRLRPDAQLIGVLSHEGLGIASYADYGSYTAYSAQPET
jgi:polysaccharide biosynthesis transport protein